jgi:hypothetical protein
MSVQAELNLSSPDLSCHVLQISGPAANPLQFNLRGNQVLT